MTAEIRPHDVSRFRTMSIGDLMRAAADLLDESRGVDCQCGASYSIGPTCEEKAIALVLAERADAIP